jgi:hypothetical protein
MTFDELSELVAMVFAAGMAIALFGVHCAAQFI